MKINLKAPNGKPTKLTEWQWHIVRTKAFKEWFGNWEDDPKNSSKVVDENGEPLVVYHGTCGDFNIFEPRKIGSASDSGMWGRGFYFASMPTTYGKSQMPVFLNIRTLFDWGKFDTPEQLGKYLGLDSSLFHEKEQRMVKVKVACHRDDFIGIVTSEIKYKGNDGILANLTGVWQEYVVFKSNQIKSAISNRGTFDPTQLDITK